MLGFILNAQMLSNDIPASFLQYKTKQVFVLRYVYIELYF